MIELMVGILRFIVPLVALLFCGHATAQNGGGNLIGTVLLNLPSYQLLGVKGGSGSSATGAAVGPVQGGNYVLGCSGTIGGATLQLQALGPDGVTWLSYGASITTLPITASVVVGSSQGSTTPNVRMLMAGGSGVSVFCTIG